ncbi:serine/threonine protein kinase [Gemmata sp. G18]|uniref:Serine/threonine protein kinase n=1 Tax=Gemmata palustris TaxID=2822762 RepID=A0ABS5BNI7_9BACT|nr:serine/threonine-protein kinase [Gemmata palustris]MBP3955226.1 serine/threonine protein kinase [Gemmata palustris]
MAAIAPVSTTDLLDLIKKSNLLPTARLLALPGPESLSVDPRQAAGALIQKNFLTKFQSTQLLAGRYKGFRIGPYVIQDLLGRGGMGAVYLGEHLELNRKVALKVLAPVRGEAQQLATERFLREARAAAALDHPNIVRVFDVARHNETPYLVMEFVDGETLQETLDRDGSVPPEVAAEYVSQAASGLQHAHERGFIHRDIKPANLIRDRFGVVKVLDMGLARSGSDEDKLTEVLDRGAVVGTADFISPEQAINCPNIDGRADIYSLGATLFTLLAGKTPFDGNTTQKLMQHQMKDVPPLAGLKPDLPTGLTEVVARMLAKKAADRYPTAAEVIAALVPWAGHSSHVVAGLSRTKIGQSADRQSVLGGWSSSGSSQRIRLVPLGTEPSDSGELDFSDTGKATIALSGAETARSRTPAPVSVPVRTVPADPLLVPVPVPRAGRGTMALVAGLAFAMLVAGVLIGWLAFGR